VSIYIRGEMDCSRIRALRRSWDARQRAGLLSKCNYTLNLSSCFELSIRRTVSSLLFRCTKGRFGEPKAIITDEAVIAPVVRNLHSAAFKLLRVHNSFF
jgi:hypothetical protein